MPPKLGVAGKRVAKELKEMDKELPEGIRWACYFFNLFMTVVDHCTSVTVVGLNVFRARLKNPDNLFEVGDIFTLLTHRSKADYRWY